MACGNRPALDRSVALHAHDPVHDGQPRLDRGRHVHDRLLQARPVQHVLGPAVDPARDDAEHVLERQRHAAPVMGLHLGHRNHQVRLQHRQRQPQLPELGVARPQTAARDLRHVEVHEGGVHVAQEIQETG